LRRAFRIVGAGTLIASLWPMEDEPARQWMADLYRERFARKRNTPEAVAYATRSQLRERRGKGLSSHPFYWGSFVAVGDGR
jgi:CHAT domain-containing protein